MRLGAASGPTGPGAAKNTFTPLTFVYGLMPPPFLFQLGSPSVVLAKGVLIMASSNLPARAPDRQPEIHTEPRLTWPRPTKKTTRFVIKVAGNIPS